MTTLVVEDAYIAHPCLCGVRAPYERWYIRKASAESLCYLCGVEDHGGNNEGRLATGIAAITRPDPQKGTSLTRGWCLEREGSAHRVHLLRRISRHLAFMLQRQSFFSCRKSRRYAAEPPARLSIRVKMFMQQGLVPTKRYACLRDTGASSFMCVECDGPSIASLLRNHAVWPTKATTAGYFDVSVGVAVS